VDCTSPPSLDLDLAAEPASVSLARHALAEFVAGHAIDRAGVEVAVSEAVSNAILHAYHGLPEPGRISVRAVLADGRLRLEVADRGHGMRPRADSPGLGLGLPLIAQVADHLDIASDEGTTLRMEFAIAER
jgi:serine/threonine-protein kinase RsbW